MREAPCRRRHGSAGREAARLRSSVEFESVELGAEAGPVGLERILSHRVEHVTFRPPVAEPLDGLTVGRERAEVRAKARWV
jgi:hypothetical protein